MKTKNLAYKIEQKHLLPLADNDDFLAMIEVGRMVNALGTALETVTELIDARDHGWKCTQFASFLHRLARQSLKLTESLAKEHYNAEYFSHFREMFCSGDILRKVPKITLRSAKPPEFRLVSDIPAVSKAIRQLDIFGVDILIPRDPADLSKAFADEDLITCELARYEILKPNTHIALQMLSREVHFIYDYGIGAEKFIKGIAKSLGLKNLDGLRKGAAVKAAVRSNVT